MTFNFTSGHEGGREKEVGRERESYRERERMKTEGEKGPLIKGATTGRKEEAEGLNDSLGSFQI